MKMIKLIIFLLIIFISCNKEDNNENEFSEGLYTVQENISSTSGNINYSNYEIEIVNKTDTSFCILSFPGAKNDTVHAKLQKDSIFIPFHKFLFYEKDTVYISGKGIIANKNKMKYTYRTGSRLGVFNCTCEATKK